VCDDKGNYMVVSYSFYSACGVTMSSLMVSRRPTLLHVSISMSLGRFESSYTSSLNVSPFVS